MVMAQVPRMISRMRLISLQFGSASNSQGLGALDAERLGPDEDHRLAAVDEGILVRFAFDFDGVFNMTVGRSLPEQRPGIV
jgi:hypothetical protein